ncbi:hypothetical protein HPB50_008365 [Hyalomma asiaticum]|uniref:Uncharacterized protein n=1 Tax=Hyalomma asiaticum TaxID=266040 RepID=A0ACB7RUY6_HYAAI|nr:hypothetical protein HPB50_008365 [Hyalomma asiaticum]
MAHLVLQMVLNISRMLQDPKINLLAAFQGVNDLQEATKGMRLDESAFTKVFQGATEIRQTRGIRIPAVRQRKVSRSVAVNFASQFFHETKEEELSVGVFYAMLDAFVEGMEARFTQEAVVLISEIMNILRLTANDEEIDVVTKYFDMESDSLRAQLRLMKAQVSTEHIKLGDCNEWLEWSQQNGLGALVYKDFFKSLKALQLSL